MIRRNALPKQIAIYGAGGHGQVLADTAHALGYEVIGFLDDAPSTHTAERLLSPTDPRLAEAGMIVAIGDNAARHQVMHKLVLDERQIVSLIHPTAWVSPTAKIGVGSFIGPHAVVNTEARIGDGVIINTGAIVEHHNHVEHYCHIAPSATLGGNVRVGAMTLVGLNAAVLPGIRIGSRCVVGAGAVVTQDIADGRRFVGVPARPIN